MKPMDTAPVDGTRCLVLSRVWHYCQRKWTYVQDGTQWVDAFYDGESWQEWCGNSKTRSTASLGPIGWAPLPSEQIE